MSRTRLSFVAAGTLFVLLVVLATLQYRWIGEVSQAERERMAASARAAAEGVASALESELSRVFHYFGPASRDSGAGPVLAEAAKRWAVESRFPLLVADVFVARRRDSAPTTLQRVDLSSGRLETVAWPSELEDARRVIEEEPRLPAGLEKGPPPRGGAHDSPHREDPARPPWRRPPPRPMPQMLDQIPALLFPVEVAESSGEGGMPAGSIAHRYVLVRLDQGAIRTRVLPDLVRQHFGTSGEYDVAVVRRSDPRVVLYRSRETFAPASVRRPDAEVALFAARPAGGWRPGGPPGRAPGQGEWRLLAVHRAGSLHAAVETTRRRNLAVSATILLLLAATFTVLLTSAHRARRLARQQVEFVAGLTHELRTPLAAIRSAGQNLADGVVADRERVRQYGRLLEREGRRLSELIEDALAHAGIQARRVSVRSGRVGIGGVLEEVTSACRPVAQEQGASLEIEIALDLPPVLGDRSALRTLFDNLLSNAIKYGGRAGKIEVQALSKGSSVEVVVRDRGPGISPRDLPRIFEPFYRGGDAASGRVAGAGLGLSLVRRIVDAHAGRIAVESEPGKGTIFRVTLPAAPEPPDSLSATTEAAS